MATVTPRRNKDGTITSWTITLSDGYLPDGSQKRIYRTFHANPNSTEKSQRSQAEKYAARLQTEYDDKRITDAKKVTFRSVYDDYIEDRIIRRGLAQQTADSYKKLFETRLLPEFGGMAIRDITAADINRFLRKLATGRIPKEKEPAHDTDPTVKKNLKGKKEQKKLSGTYCLKFFQQLNEMMGYAQRSGIIAVNPCDMVEPPKRDTKEAQYYDLPECVQIADLLEKWPEAEWRAFFSLAFYCGCRPGELIGMNWKDYDGDNIFIQAGSYQGKGEKCKRTDKPKTKKSIRRISLTPEAQKALEAWKREQAAQRLKCGECWQDPDAVFTNEDGERIRPQRPTKEWKNFTTKNQIRHLPLYDLRHTNCSMLISSRELSVEEVAARMGHEQTSTTLNIYSHAFSNFNEKANAALSNVLKRSANQ